MLIPLRGTPAAPPAASVPDVLPSPQPSAAQVFTAVAPANPSASYSTEPQPLSQPNQAQVSAARPLSPAEAAPPAVDSPAPDALAWDAPEMADRRDSTWYGAVALAAIVLSVLVFTATRDFVSSGVVLFALAGILFFYTKKPQGGRYTMAAGAVSVGRKQYHLNAFKAFSVSPESGVIAVSLLPLQRFMPMVVLYVPASLEQAVTEQLRVYLPEEPHRPDPMDNFLRTLRF